MQITMRKIIFKSNILNLIAAVSSKKESLVIRLENYEQSPTTDFYHECNSEDRTIAPKPQPP